MEDQSHCGDAAPTHCLIEEEYTIAVPLVRPKPSFLDLLRLAGATNEVFTRKEILHYLKIYIVSKQMFDLNNPSIVHCQGDLLGEVFGVSQFTINDVLKLLAENCMQLPDTHLQRRRRLISKPPVNSNTLPTSSAGEESKAANQTSSPIISSTSSTKSAARQLNLPHTKSRKSSSSSSSCDKIDNTENAKPSSSQKRSQSSSTLKCQDQVSASKAQESSGGVNHTSDSSETEKGVGSRKRKRKNSSSPTETSRRRGASLSITYGDDGDKESYPWYFQLELGDRSDNDKSEVLSVQGKETVVVQDSTDDLWFLEEDSVAVEVPSDTEFSIEYDVESDISPATESDLSSVRSGESFLVVCKESDVEFFADCSDSDSDDGDKELTEADYWCCTECHQSNPPVQRYCGRCWKLRTDWLRSQCGSDDKRDIQKGSKERNDTCTNSASKGFKDDELTSHFLRKEEKFSGFDSGVGSLSLTLPSSQETVTSDVSVFCDTPGGKSVPTLVQGDYEASAFMKEAQLIESRYSFANIQMKQRSLSCNSITSVDYADEINKSSPTAQTPGIAVDDPCMICLTHPKTASLIHGTTGHQVCCFSCGKRLKRRGKLCPVCRRPIQKVVRNYIL